MIEITASTALITVDEFKAYAGVNVFNYDTLIGRIIDAMTAEMEKYTQRILRKVTISETFLNPDKVLREPIDVDDFIESQEFPLISVTSITTTLDDADTVMASTNYTVDKSLGRIFFTDTSDWEAADSAVVVYESGWDTPPADLLDILYQLVHIRYTAAISGETPSATRGPVKFERVDGAVSVSYDTSGMSGSSSAGGSKIDPILGNFTTNLDYYRSDRAIG